MSLLESINTQAAACRRAAEVWRSLAVRDRVKPLAELRHLLVETADELCAAVQLEIGRLPEEVIATDVLPFADACRFLERDAASILKPQRVKLSRRPLWLWGQRDTVHRRPHGVVGIIGTWNYPLLLNGVQIAQALVAGNGVLWKPSELSMKSAPQLCSLFRRAGFPPDLQQLLPATRDAGPALADADVDHIVFTGSATTGRRLAARLGERLVSSTLELSGCDPMFVLGDADVELAARAAWYGATANGGQTCIAPRRAFVAREVYEAFVDRLRQQVETAAPIHLATAAQREHADRLVADAESRGASVLSPVTSSAAEQSEPRVITDATTDMAACREDCFSPLISVIPVNEADEALRLAESCAFGLGASVFSRDTKGATALAPRIRAGMVTVNDVVAPTAHPATPFGGRGQSGWGVTQGAEGLLAMTVPQVVSVRSGRFRPHYEPTGGPDGPTPQLIRGLLAWCHARSVVSRWRGLWSMVRAARRM